MTAWELRLGDCLHGVAGLASVAEGEAVVITDPIWPNVPDGMFGEVNPLALFSRAAAHFPRISRRAVVWLGCSSDPRFLSAVPRGLPFVRACWLRYARPHYAGTILGSGDVAYVFGDNRGPHDATLLPGECTSTSTAGKEAKHPCPRKVEHAEWLVKNFTDPGDLVIDPFAGSGTTGVAAIRLGRRFLGWEKDPTFYAGAFARLNATREQLRLPVRATAKQGALGLR